ncbi:uncharacterized protein B0H18DRAFT_996001 [Fomitopsis serialis]|uniref:uncharacterized protein n=1 Tax=Fomitopsis serialis TaxID=139415 RepID=UPI002007A4D0|nr:uncharacterized protein B0H18DRAFT_996001 [Neoantrodia serialis]KAH9929733.1 hypothetical protein B0H18DRAFT_996001 [Neoantrodia serialis]
MPEAQDMFRVSPWITYDPSSDARAETLARNMDAPQISTLPDTPEPAPARTSKFRVKLLVNEGKRASSHSSTAPHARTKRASDEDEDEDEEEEDQLIDDDDDEPSRPSRSAHAIQPAPVPTPSTSGRGQATKRGQGRGRGRGRDPTHLVHTDFFDPNIPGSSAFSLVPPPTAPVATKKKAAPGKGATAQRAIKKRPRTAKVTAAAVVAPIPLPIHRDDAESIISESYPVTAASSPLPHEERTPEPDMTMPTSIYSLPMDDGFTLDGVAFPQYPLPSKPFPVQPAPKIGTGFAPTIVLDKSKKPVRRWRQVNREVRGIAGGRWFTRSWVGEKESDFASHQTAASQAVTLAAQSAADRADREAASAAAMLAAGITLPPKLAGTSASAPPGRGPRPKVPKGETPLSTMPSSRQDSAVPESISAQIPKTGMAHGSLSDVPVTPAPPA